MLNPDGRVDDNDDNDMDAFTPENLVAALRD